MKSNRLIILALITIAAIVAAMLVNQQRAPSSSIEKEILFPALAGQINDVTGVQLLGYDRELNLVRTEDGWVINEADSYPADFGKIRETVIAVSRLMLLSRKTSNPELYDRLGVEDPLEEDANSLLLSLKGEDSADLATLIVGKSRRSSSAQSQSGLYVRLPDSETALLVEGRLDVSADIRDWFDRELMDIDSARISKVVIEHDDGPQVSLHRAEDVDDFNLDDIPEDREIQSAVIISRMATLLEDLNADSVVKAEKIEDDISSTARISTFDGLEVSIRSAVMDDVNYANFSFSAAREQTEETDADDREENNEPDSGTAEDKLSPAEEAESLNAKLGGWAYAIPGYKFELFTRKLEDLVRDRQEDSDTTEDESAGSG